jgi:LacI family transcriptional regulator
MDTASNMRYQIILTVSRESAETEQNNIMTLLSMRVDGLLVAISKDTQDKKIYETAKKVNTPLVFFDRAVEGVDFSSVGIDDRRDAAKLVEYAIQCGYTKIAHLSGSQKISIGKNRYTGYMDMIKKYKLPVYPDWIVEGGFDKQSGYDGFKALYRAKELPQLVFAANDRVAQGAYKAIKEKGLQIPEQIGVIAFGHSEFAELLSPSLTIVDCPPDVLGRKAMELLNNEIENPENHKPKRVTLETRLRINESTLKKI